MKRAKNPSHEPITKLCLVLEIDRRTPEGRIRSEREFRDHFFPYDAESATDRVFKFLPNDVRGPIVSSWGIRGLKTAIRDDDERVTNTVHDALLADDIDDAIFERGLAAETLVSWCELGDWWAFWRRGVHTKHSIGLALQTAYDLELFDAAWFFEVLELAGLRGTDVLVQGLAKADLGRWIRHIHASGDGSPKGLIAALGWTALVDHTPDSVVLRVIDGFATKCGLAEQPKDVTLLGPGSANGSPRVSLTPATASAPQANVSALPSRANPPASAKAKLG